MKRGLSLERLARSSGVSRAMLGQIELGRSAPTINVLWKIARALGVTLSTLVTAPETATPVVLPAATARWVRSPRGGLASRALFPLEHPHGIEFYELTLEAGATEPGQAYPPGTRETVVVSRGTVEVSVAGCVHSLGVGDAVLFAADEPVRYSNPGAEEAQMFLVTYWESVT